MRLVVTLATRGRPAQLLQTIAADLKCLSLENSVLMVQVDADDFATQHALSTVKLDPRVMVSVGPREDTIAAKWNRAMAIPADVYLVMADDDPLATPESDAKLLKAVQIFPDGIGIAYGHMTSVSFSSVYGMTAKFVEKLGYIQPELFPYWFVDHWTDSVARMIGRLVFADVRTDQRGAGKTMEMREPGWWATFFDAAYLERHNTARKIIESPEFATTGWQRDQLIESFMLTSHRDRWINQGVRNSAGQLETWAGLREMDDRYKRVKQKAIDLVPHFLNDFEMPEEERMGYRNFLTPPDNIVALPRAFG